MKIYFCKLCVKKKHYDDVPVCPECHEEHLRITRLYTQFVARNPKARKYSIAEVFERLMSNYEGKSNEHS